MGLDGSEKTHELFEAIVPIPNALIDQRAARLVGFQERYAAIHKDVQLLLAPEELAKWSQRHHKKALKVVEILADRYPLVVFHGDVGTGKTATAEGIASRIAKETGREGALYKLSTRVRGKGLHGEMSRLVSEAFQEIEQQLGKKRLAFLLIDEADAVASSRAAAQSHQEEKAGTNTLIQKLDDARRHGGRLVVFLCTNRLSAVDPAVVRRAAREEAFSRPTTSQREQLLREDLSDLGLSKAELQELVELTGPRPKDGRPLGLTFSDLRTRMLPAALLLAFPDGPLTFAALREAARSTPPSPALAEASETGA